MKELIATDKIHILQGYAVKIMLKRNCSVSMYYTASEIKGEEDNSEQQ